jgi:prevent-host-death family protein
MHRLDEPDRKSYYSHVKKASITDAKNRLSALIDQVQHGDSVLIVDRGRPVARLESAGCNLAGEPEGRLARLERLGLARRPVASPPSKLVAQAPPRARASVLAALLEERAAGR